MISRVAEEEEMEEVDMTDGPDNVAMKFEFEDIETDKMEKVIIEADDDTVDCQSIISEFFSACFCRLTGSDSRCNFFLL